jgi:SAM-dependent methyltransferase
MNDGSYLDTARDLYRHAALIPQAGLCCTTSPLWRLPDLHVPERMLAMNYGCGSTVHARDLCGDPTVLYVGVGGGMELLQFAYFCRRPGAVIGIDSVEEMIDACQRNLVAAQAENPWFRSDHITLRQGDALALPLADGSVDLAAQNCLFNIFRAADLHRALGEMYRVLKPHGRLILSDPICDLPIPEGLQSDQRLRALCLSGAIPLSEYVNQLTGTGFGTIEIRARRPYRVLSPRHYATDRLLVIDSVEICAIKEPVPADGPCVFTGRTAIYHGEQAQFDDGKGHELAQNRPLSVCDKTAAALAALGRDDIHISAPTYFYDGGGCC